MRTKTTLNIKFAPVNGKHKETDIAVLFVFEGKIISDAVKNFGPENAKFIAAVLKSDKKFDGKDGEAKSISLPGGAAFSQVLLIGLGAPGATDSVKAENTGAKMAIALEGAGAVHAVVFTDAMKGFKGIKPGDFFAHMALGANLRSYKFLKYKTPAKDEKPKLSSITFTGNADAGKIYSKLDAVAQGVYFTRDLVNEPPNVLYPESFANIIKAELKPLGVEVEIIDHKKMEKMGMGAALAVGQGSIRPPCMVVMRINAGSKQKPLVFVGKGVTFDTGGISIKPAQGMEEMKMDMGGAAAVVGLMKSLALVKSKAPIVAIVGLAENMPSDRAYRPSDIVTSHAGKTIEVLNTDAEGRLVLCDALSYLQKTYAPRFVIDLATLTGAIVVALGSEYAGVFANDDKLWAQIEGAGKSTGEKIWRMPLAAAYKKEMEGTMADLRNIGKGRNAGACTAAGFLEHFIEKGTPWAHFDIAGTAWSSSDPLTAMPQTGTGFGVRLLHRLVQENYE
jgi:leucyl aminopeptidase